MALIRPPFRPPPAPSPPRRSTNIVLCARVSFVSAFVHERVYMHTRVQIRRQNAHTRHHIRTSLSSRLRSGAHLRTDWDSSASVLSRCVFLFKCVTGVCICARFWLPAAPKSPVIVIATDTHYLISACHYALILCAGNYSDRDANGEHLYGTQYAQTALNWNELSVTL